MTKIRVRYPDRVRFDRERLGHLPISLATATVAPAPRLRRRRARTPRRPLGSASCRCASSPRSALSAVPMSSGAKISSRSSRSPPSWKTATWARSIATCKPSWPAGVPPGYRWELAGNYRAQQESFASLLMVLIVAAALVFLLLGFQFHSLTLPLLIFLAQPISLASALFALWITGTPLNVSSFMGAILLIGLDVKNGIILIEYIGQLRARGHAAARGAGAGRPHPVPADPDDQPVHDLRPRAAGPRAGAPAPDAAAAGDRRHRRPDHQHAADAAVDPGRLPGTARRPRRGPCRGGIVSKVTHGKTTVCLLPKSCPTKFRQIASAILAPPCREGSTWEMKSAASVQMTLSSRTGN